MKKLINSKIFLILISIFISFPVILPYFHQGYFPTHDGEWAVVRIVEMFREIKDFQFPARYSGYLNFGYGYPLFNFAYPFPYYLGIFIHFLKFSFTDSIKIIFTISVPLSFLFMALLSRELWKSTMSGFVSAVLYIYLPYRMVDLYVRGSIGESLSFFFFAAIFYIVVKIINKSSKVLIGVGSIFYASLITTHNIMAIYFTIIYVLFLLYFLLQKKYKVVFPLFVLMFFGFSLSAFFWLPALFEKSKILLSIVPIADRNLYYVDFNQLIFPRWGYGVPTDKNGFSYQLGFPQLIVLLSTILFLIWQYLKEKKKLLRKGSIKYAILLSAISLVLISIMFRQFGFVWRLPLLSEINYPWTLLLPIGFIVSLLAGFIASQKNLLKYIAITSAAVSIVVFLPYAKPEYYVDRGDSFYMTNDATTTSSSEYTPLWVKTKPFQRTDTKVEILTGRGEIKDLVYNSKKISFDASLPNDSIIRVNTIYYPGWKAYVNDKELSLGYNNDKGVMEISVPKGNHNILFSFSETPLRQLADIVSGLSFISLLIFLRFYKLKL